MDRETRARVRQLSSVNPRWGAHRIPAVQRLQAKLDVGREAAEVGCGAGQCNVPVAAAYPNSRTGYNADDASIARARSKAASRRCHESSRL
jgi:hypothetical protein